MLSFIKGSEMDKYYNNTSTCFFSYVATRDDWFYFGKLRAYEVTDNSTGTPITLTPSFTNKTLNFTKLLGTNFADSLPWCFRYADSIKYYEDTRWQTYDRSPGRFIEGFLFNMMGSANEFLKYFDKTEIYMNNYNDKGELEP